jgi:hypothetical protein
LTGKTGHRNNTTIGQRESRHSLPTLLCFISLPTAQNILKFIANPQMAHLVLPDTSQPFTKPKEPILPTL